MQIVPDVFQIATFMETATFMVVLVCFMLLMLIASKLSELVKLFTNHIEAVKLLADAFDYEDIDERRERIKSIKRRHLTPP